MAKAEILITSGSPDGVHEHTLLEGETAIRDGYQYFLDEIKDKRADWLLGASIKRDFEDNMYVEATVRIGPVAHWEDDYYKERGTGKYALIKEWEDRFQENGPDAESSAHSSAEH